MGSSGTHSMRTHRSVINNDFPKPFPNMIYRPYGADDLLHIPSYPDLIPMGSNANDFAETSLFSPIVLSPI